MLEKIGPDGNLSTGVQEVEADEVDTSLNGDVRAETEAEVDLDLCRQVDLGADTNGKGLGHEAIEVGANDLLGDDGQVNVVTLLESEVEARGQVNGGTNTNNEVQGKSGTQADLNKTGINLELRRCNKLNRLVDSSGSRDVDLEVGLDTGKVQA